MALNVDKLKDRVEGTYAEYRSRVTRRMLIAFFVGFGVGIVFVGLTGSGCPSVGG